MDRSGARTKDRTTFAGHASLQITLDCYGHLFPSGNGKLAMDQIAKGAIRVNVTRTIVPTMCHPLAGTRWNELVTHWF
jgi:hypothetical protein